MVIRGRLNTTIFFIGLVVGLGAAWLGREHGIPWMGGNATANSILGGIAPWLVDFSPFSIVLAAVSCAIGFTWIVHVSTPFWRMAVGTGIGALLIYVIDPVALFVLFAFASASWWLLRRENLASRTYRWAAWAGVVLLVGYKVAQSSLAGGYDQYWEFFSIIGISYFTFRISSVLFDRARGMEIDRDPMRYFHFCFFFPIFLGGPVERYQGFEVNRDGWLDNVANGTFLIARAGIKKLLIADVVLIAVSNDLYGTITSPEGSEWPFIAVMGYGALGLIRAFFDLSAFTDLAHGLGRYFGYTLSPNFNKPYVATSMVDFWRRWHMTIAGWAKDYIFTPLFFKTKRLLPSVMLTMVSMGLWHYLSFGWLIWGVLHGLGIVVSGAWERSPLSKRFSKKVDDVGHSVMNVIAGSHRDALSSPLRRVGMVLRVFPAWALTMFWASFCFVSVSRLNTQQSMDLYAIMVSNLLGGG